MIASRGRTTAIAAAVVTIVVILAGIVACHGYLLETYFIWKLDSKDQRVRRMAHSWLGEHKSVRAVPHLMRILRSYEEIDPDAASATTLRAIGPPAVPALAEALRDPSFELRHEIARILRRMGPQAKDAVPALAEALGVKGGVLRKKAAEALWAMGPEARGAVPALIRGLRVDNRGPGEDLFQIACSRALGSMGSDAREAIPALEERTRDEDPGVRDAAAQALEHIRSGKPGIPGTRSDE